ncbi:MAG: cyclase family protein, partial [Myxococcales bacterium]|nr:cyclase family protein [Myxococcales bacterium]
RHGRLPDGVIVLFRTGFGARWPDAASYLGTAERGAAAVAKLHFPGIAAETARWLADEREIGAVGIDTASIDPGQSTRFEAHRILYEQNIPGFENVAHLDRLPATGFTIIALPMKIRSGSGGPLRIVAVVP